MDKPKYRYINISNPRKKRLQNAKKFLLSPEYKDISDLLVREVQNG